MDVDLGNLFLGNVDPIPLGHGETDNNDRPNATDRRTESVPSVTVTNAQKEELLHRLDMLREQKPYMFENGAPKLEANPAAARTYRAVLRDGTWRAVVRPKTNYRPDYRAALRQQRIMQKTLQNSQAINMGMVGIPAADLLDSLNRWELDSAGEQFDNYELMGYKTKGKTDAVPGTAAIKNHKPQVWSLHGKTLTPNRPTFMDFATAPENIPVAKEINTRKLRQLKAVYRSDAPNSLNVVEVKKII